MKTAAWIMLLVAVFVGLIYLLAVGGDLLEKHHCEAQRAHLIAAGWTPPPVNSCETSYRDIVQ